MLCAVCKSDRVHRSRRSGLREQLASLLFYFPYRCHACGRRFLRFSFSPPARAAKTDSATEREIRATRSRIERTRRWREILLYGLGLLLFLVFLYFVTRERLGPSE